MLRKITRNKQVTIPKEFMDRLHINEGDYVMIECENNSIRMRPVVIDEFSREDYEKLAIKLDQLKNESESGYNDSKSARMHLKRMMK